MSMSKIKFGKEGLTFDDVLIIPAESDVSPQSVSTQTRLTRNIYLNVPICSSAMDTVTEARLAISLAREGGIGIIHRNCSVEDQVQEVDKVKRSESGMIINPITISSDKSIKDALEMMKQYKISGVPVIDNDKLVGILTNRDIRFEGNLDLKVKDRMTSTNLITVPVGTTLNDAKTVLIRFRIFDDSESTFGKKFQKKRYPTKIYVTFLKIFLQKLLTKIIIF